MLLAVPQGQLVLVLVHLVVVGEVVVHSCSTCLHLFWLQPGHFPCVMGAASCFAAPDLQGLRKCVMKRYTLTDRVHGSPRC